MKVRVETLIGKALNNAVGHAMGWVDYPEDSVEQGSVWHQNTERAPFGRIMSKAAWTPSTDRNQAGEIIEANLIQTNPKWHNDQCAVQPKWQMHGFDAEVGWHWEAHILGPENIDDPFTQNGATPAIAAMRCFVRMKLGEEIDVRFTQ